MAGLLVLTLGVGDAASQVKTESEQYLVKIAKSAPASTSRIAVRFSPFFQTFSRFLCTQFSQILVWMYTYIGVLFHLLGQALEALAIMCFVCNVDEDKEEEMAIFWQIFGHTGVEASDQVLLPVIYNYLAVLIHVLETLQAG